MVSPDQRHGSSGDSQLAEGFSTWEKDVVKVLAKSARKEPGEMPSDAWRSLIHTTPDGIAVNPLYTGLDDIPEHPAPGQFPFVRGGKREGLPDGAWHVTEHFTAGSDPKSANELLVDSLGHGTSAVSLDASAADIPALLEGVFLELAPVIVDAGGHTPETTAALFSLIDSAAEAGDLTGERKDIRVLAACAPGTAAVFGYESASTDDAVSTAVAAAGRGEAIRSLLADGASAHERGATDGQELGIALAAAVEYVRALANAGLSTAQALDQIWFRFSATPDQFATIVKMRAARTLWARVCEVLGEPEHGDAPQHAVTSLAASTRRDPYVNMLRSTVAAFAAGLGGAEYVTVNAFDATLDGGLSGTSRSFASRMARNTQLLLIEESHLGHVVDPAGGSWYVESRTAELAETAWTYFQEIESAGGLFASSDKVSSDLVAARAARTALVANRKHPLTGLSEFPNLAEKPLPKEQRAPQRYFYGEAYESLRDRSDDFLDRTGQRPTVAFFGLGKVAERSARNTFVVNLFAAGGIVAHDVEVTAIDDYAKAAKDFVTSPVGAAQASFIAVLCGADIRYSEAGADAVAALRDAGADIVYVAGSAKPFAEAEGNGRPDEFLSMGVDVIETMSSVASQLGVK